MKKIITEIEKKSFKTYKVNICNDCYNLIGEMCHNYYCIFIRRTMKEVKHYLDIIFIRPIVDGESLDLYPQDKPI